MTILQIHDNCQEVVKVKQLLAKQGFWSDSNMSQMYTSKLSEAVAYFQQTHLNEYGVPCSVDGHVGPETWWALKHPTGKAQKSNLSNNDIPKGIGDLRTKILEVALAQHGIKEAPNGSNRGSKPKGGVDKFLPDWVKKPGKKGPSWCCFFTSYVTKEAFGKYPLGRRHGSCKKAWQAASERGMTIINNLDLAAPGDAFVLLHANGTGHIGFVYNIDPNYKYFNTIEGNCGNRVKIGKRSVKEIHGFINFCVDDPDDADLNFERKLIEAPNVGSSGTR